MSKIKGKYSNKEHVEIDKGFHWYQKEAENGDAEAQNTLALLYYNGDGPEKCLETAFHWCKKAAENGCVKAQYNLALTYENGEGTEYDLEKAFHWYQKAAEN